MEKTAANIDDVKELLPNLSDDALREVRDFAAYLLDRDRRRKVLVERVLKAEKEHDSIICNSVEEAMQAILDEPDDDAA
jgi:hypothetical protein